MVKRRKKTKVLSNGQKLASERNWNKGKILGTRTMVNNIKNAETTKLAERIALSTIIHNLDKILKNWNK